MYVLINAYNNTKEDDDWIFGFMYFLMEFSTIFLKRIFEQNLILQF